MSARRTSRICSVCSKPVYEVDFHHGDPGEWPLLIGYAVGKDDGHSPLEPTANAALQNHHKKEHSMPTDSSWTLTPGKPDSKTLCTGCRKFVVEQPTFLYGDQRLCRYCAVLTCLQALDSFKVLKDFGLRPQPDLDRRMADDFAQQSSIADSSKLLQDSLDRASRMRTLLAEALHHPSGDFRSGSWFSEWWTGWRQRVAKELGCAPNFGGSK